MDRLVRGRYKTNRSPVYNLLSAEEQNDLLQAAVEILERTGAEIDDPGFKDLFKQAGCHVDGNRIRFPAGLSEWALSRVPSRVTLYNRDSTGVMVLEGRRTYFGPGGKYAYYLDPALGERKKTGLRDLTNLAILCDYLPNVDFVMAPGFLSGLEEPVDPLLVFKAVVTNCSKPFVTGAPTAGQCAQIIDLASAVAGGLDHLGRKPFICLYSEPPSPLVHSSEALGRVVLAAEKGIPLIYNPPLLLGATAPATMAAAIALGVADCIVGAVASQLTRAGAPYIMGGFYAISDQKNGAGSCGRPEVGSMQAASAEVAHYLKMPVFGAAGCTDAHTLDGQAAGEAALGIFLAAEAGVNMVCGLDSIGSGMTGSLQQLVMNDEIVAMVKRFMRGIPVNDHSLAVDVIDKVGPGGHFLAEKHTIANFKNETWFPSLMDRLRYDGWKNMAGGTAMGERIAEKTNQILKDHRAPLLPSPVMEKMEQIIAEKEQGA